MISPLRSWLSKCVLPITLLAIISTTFGPANAQVIVLPPSQENGKPHCVDRRTTREMKCPDATELTYEKSIVRRLWMANDYAGLDALYMRWCSGRDRLTDGQWKLALFGESLASSFGAWDGWDHDLKKIQTWRGNARNSPAASMVEALYWHSYAWQTRGGGYASTVSKEGWELFRERMEKARAVIASDAAGLAICPDLHALSLDVLLELGMDEARMRSVFDPAQKLWPEYHQLYFSMARRYQPSWGGNASMYDKFAQEAAGMTSSFEGAGMYARLYWLVDRRDGLPLLHGERQRRVPSWDRLRAGYQDLLKRYPESIRNIGKFAEVACRGDDSALYKSLRAQIVGYENFVPFLDPVEVCDVRHGFNPRRT